MKTVDLETELLFLPLPDGRLTFQLELDGPSPRGGRHKVPEAEGKVVEADVAVAVVVEVVEDGVGVAVLDAEIAAEVAKLLLADEAVAAGVAALEQLLQPEVRVVTHDCHHCDSMPPRSLKAQFSFLRLSVPSGTIATPSGALTSALCPASHHCPKKALAVSEIPGGLETLSVTQGMGQALLYPSWSNYRDFMRSDDKYSTIRICPLIRFMLHVSCFKWTFLALRCERSLAFLRPHTEHLCDDDGVRGGGGGG